MNDDDVIDGLFQYLIDQDLLETRYNRNNKEQELRITDKGKDIFNTLTFFMKGGDS